jgi:electron transport complex protein RnfB
MMASPIMLPALVVGGLGLLCGLGLALAALLFGAARDSRVDRIQARLPKVDCTACGYDGCAAFALAVAAGKAPPAGCAPGGPKAAHAIGDIVGVAVPEVLEQMAVVHCKGGDAEARPRALYAGLADCHAAELTGQSPRVCAEGCLGLGSCVRACPFGAISVNANHVAVVDAGRCTGCGLCVAACPRNIVELIPQLHKIYLACANHDAGTAVQQYCSVGCTACTMCVMATPSGAVRIENNLPVLDYSMQEHFVVAANKCPMKCFVDLIKTRPMANIDSKCDGCGACLLACPVDAISGQKDKRHTVDKTRCIGCGICIGVCHVHAIVLWGSLGYATDEWKKRTRA